MTQRSKRLMGTIVSISLVVGWLVGIISGLPDAILTVVDHGPMIFRHPNFWWSITALLVLVLALRWIWLRPDEPLDSVIAFLRSAMASAAKTISDDFQNGDRRGMAVAAVDKFTFQTVPFFLETKIGESERARFEAAMSSAKAKAPRDELAAYHAALIYLDHFIETRQLTLAGKIPQHA